MKILVFSDSHGSTSNMIKVIERHLDIEYIIHLGDYGSDILKVNELFPTHLTEAVQGNNDKQRLYSLEQTITLVGKKILLVHGHNYGVKYSLSSLTAKGLIEKYDLILFGHTHEPVNERREGLLLVNPGSIAKPYKLIRPSYAVVEITHQSIEVTILNV